MSKLIDSTGKRFGRLIVLERAPNNKWGQSRWLCLCDCGEKTVVYSIHLRSKRTQSCGCLNREKRTTHGHTVRGRSSKVYSVWRAMVQRCTNNSYKQWENYGGRGIRVCERWLKFENFLEDMGDKPEGYQIDRIDNDGGYFKENCRWATRRQNNRNKRSNRLITFDGKTQCLTEWAEEIGICLETICKRFQLGWSAEEVLTISVGKRGKNG